MTDFNCDLKELKNKIAEKNRLEAILKELNSQYEEIKKKTAELKIITDKEQADVERLQGMSFAGLIAAIFGNREEKLTHEQQEAYLAAAKYNAAQNELETIEREIFETDKRLRDFRGCEQEYERLFEQKKAVLKASNGESAEAFQKFERKYIALETQRREINEALTAARNVRGICENIAEKLNSAENWGTYDLLAGGTFSGMIKHSRLDSAQNGVEHLQSALRRLNTELSDVNIEFGVKVNIDGFMRFADYFYDSFVVDKLVLD